MDGPIEMLEMGRQLSRHATIALRPRISKAAGIAASRCS